VNGFAEVAKGAQITITRRGLPVARLVRTEVARRGVTSQHEHVADVIQNLSKLRKGVLLDGNAGDLIGRGRD
jgi:antitoxin (DNA-binding transcriptional repressor) of toxin-antitoxin stability system